jgi:uncharacterized protein
MKPVLDQFGFSNAPNIGSLLRPTDTGFRVAVVGSGITGLGCAHALAQWAQVTVYEANRTLGGHSNAVDVHLDGISHPVDTGFLVFNDRTYPNLQKLFAQLNVDQARTDMSFAVSLGPYAYEWCGANDLSKVFAQPTNILRPRFWFMLRDMLRFNKAATQIARREDLASLNTSLGNYLKQHRYSQAFAQDYLLPMAAAIWSCPIKEILAFPMSTFVRFCDNHGLLQVNNRPQWLTVKGSSRQYVSKIASAIEQLGGQLKVDTKVLRVSLRSGKPVVHTKQGEEEFDAVFFASHSDQTMALLPEEANAAKALLKQVRYNPNRAVLHTDIRLMPKRRRAWAAWNYLATPVQDDGRDVSITYWINQLQPLPFKTDVFVTLNPILEPDKKRILGEFDYMHPVFDQLAIEAQRKLSTVQGDHQFWFGGAWTGYGFHEDGLKAGLHAAELIRAYATQ